ncbi:LysR family transcriptional regulator [Streptomyces sp. 3214.6]|uniref:LysR family transcriptional regulator n=1 Tax=Streptomyces sp. 3214.6 TaxID=1882757 RepID=UPI0026CC9870
MTLLTWWRCTLPSSRAVQVAALERSLGSKVVARSTRGVTPTEAGRIMVEAAESVNAGLEHARRQVERLDTGRTKLTVATFTSGGRLLLPAASARPTAAHPDTELHVVEAEPEGSLPLVGRMSWTWRSPTTSTARCQVGRARVPA